MTTRHSNLAFYKPNGLPWTRDEVHHVGHLCNADSATNVDPEKQYVYNDSKLTINMCNWSRQAADRIDKCIIVPYYQTLTIDNLNKYLAIKQLKTYNIKDYK